MGIEPINGGFANHCLTGWLPRRARWRVAQRLGRGRAGVKPWISRIVAKARRERKTMPCVAGAGGGGAPAPLKKGGEAVHLPRCMPVQSQSDSHCAPHGLGGWKPPLPYHAGASAASRAARASSSSTTVAHSGGSNTMVSRTGRVSRPWERAARQTASPRRAARGNLAPPG